MFKVKTGKRNSRSVKVRSDLLRDSYVFLHHQDSETNPANISASQILTLRPLNVCGIKSSAIILHEQGSTQKYVTYLVPQCFPCSQRHLASTRGLYVKSMAHLLSGQATLNKHCITRSQQCMMLPGLRHASGPFQLHPSFLLSSERKTPQCSKVSFLAEYFSSKPNVPFHSSIRQSAFCFEPMKCQEAC